MSCCLPPIFPIQRRLWMATARAAVGATCLLESLQTAFRTILLSNVLLDERNKAAAVLFTGICNCRHACQCMIERATRAAGRFVRLWGIRLFNRLAGNLVELTGWRRIERIRYA